VQAWRAGKRLRALLVGGSIIVFMLLGGIQAPLIDAGLLRIPYMISFAFLAIVFALAYELTDSTRRASILERQRAEALADAREAHEGFERLARASLLGELVTGIAHELNQPLAAILANAQAAKRLLAAPAPDFDELRAIVDDVVRDDKRAGEMIHRLRELLQKRASQRERFPLAALVRETADLLHAELRAHDIRLSLELGDPAWTVDADRVGLQQVVLNLLSNAIRALREAPEADRQLKLRLERRNGAVRLIVIDGGPGIAPEVLPHVFDPFYTSNMGSLGMGLAICKRIVEAQGGTIEAHNRADGGAELGVTLPMAKRNA
jgi:C4-dicarboxylate-specific signal transduction histidine kinase